MCPCLSWWIAKKAWQCPAGFLLQSGVGPVGSKVCTGEPRQISIIEDVCTSTSTHIDYVVLRLALWVGKAMATSVGLESAQVGWEGLEVQSIATFSKRALNLSFLMSFPFLKSSFLLRLICLLPLLLLPLFALPSVSSSCFFFPSVSSFLLTSGRGRVQSKSVLQKSLKPIFSAKPQSHHICHFTEL